jgi:hypothetical protein
LFAPARLVVVDVEGRTRLTIIDRIRAGAISDEEHHSRTISPGLAVDPESRRAFVVPHAGPIAEIDLQTLRVTYHELDQPSLLGRLLSWLTPAAQAKVLEGLVREARWLGDGMLAVSGVDYSLAASATGQPPLVAAPAGLSLVNTRSWTSRVLDDQASGFAVGSGLVVAQGGSWDSGQERGQGPGLRAFGLDGRQRWQHRPGENLWMDPAGSVGYAYVSESSAEVIDLATGSVLATVRLDDRNPMPELLAAQTSSW